MEIVSAHREKWIVFIYEFIGTMFLLYAINLQATFPFGQFGIAFMIFAFLLIGGPITGAHYNPAVTLGVWLCDTHMCHDAIMMIVMMLA